MCARLFHAEFMANAESEEEEERAPDDRLCGGKNFEYGGLPSDKVGIEKILAEAEDVERIRDAEAECFPIWVRAEVPECRRPRRDCNSRAKKWSSSSCFFSRSISSLRQA